VYTRYADDFTFSLQQDDRAAIHKLIRDTKRIVADSGYELHQGRKLRIRRRHQRQLVTGLVVNSAVNLPRRLRHRLRAVEHHLATGRPATLTPAQLAGWHALRRMITAQAPAQ
jgi:RNA-directed DNA polymerase